MSNILKNEKSPYLQQHKDNPVDWFPWNKETLDKAKKEKKPIFLSTGGGNFSDIKRAFNVINKKIINWIKNEE